MINIKPFEIERYFAKHEFSARYLLSASDCEPLSLQELLAIATTETKNIWDSLMLGYTETQGHPLLRQEIAKLYKHVQPEEVIVLTPEEGVFITMNVPLEKGDHVIATSPGYQSLHEIATSLDCEVTKWKPNVETWEFDVNFVRDNIKPNTKLLVINFPHNPTGSMLSAQQLDQLIQIAQENDICIFSDETYRLLEYDESARLPSVADVYENSISLFSVSKSFGLAGLRIGWLTTRNPDLLQKIATLKDYTTICNSAPSEVLAVIALQAKDSIIKRNLEIIAKNLEAFNNFASRHPDIIKWRPPKAGSVGFPELLGKNVYQLCEDVVQAKGVMVLPGTVYDSKSNNFRVGLGRKDFRRALKKFEEYINEI